MSIGRRPKTEHMFRKLDVSRKHGPSIFVYRTMDKVQKDRDNKQTIWLRNITVSTTCDAMNEPV
jgi:hypothetical protein